MNVPFGAAVTVPAGCQAAGVALERHRRTGRGAALELDRLARIGRARGRGQLRREHLELRTHAEVQAAHVGLCARGVEALREALEAPDDPGREGRRP